MNEIARVGVDLAKRVI